MRCVLGNGDDLVEEVIYTVVGCGDISLFLWLQDMLLLLLKRIIIDFVTLWLGFVYLGADTISPSLKANSKLVDCQFQYKIISVHFVLINLYCNLLSITYLEMQGYGGGGCFNILAIVVPQICDGMIGICAIADTISPSLKANLKLVDQQSVGAACISIYFYITQLKI